MLLLHKKVQ